MWEKLGGGTVKTTGGEREVSWLRDTVDVETEQPVLNNGHAHSYL